MEGSGTARTECLAHGVSPTNVICDCRYPQGSTRCMDVNLDTTGGRSRRYVKYNFKGSYRNATAQNERTKKSKLCPENNCLKEKAIGPVPPPTKQRATHVMKDASRTGNGTCSERRTDSDTQTHILCPRPDLPSRGGSEARPRGGLDVYLLRLERK